MKFLKTETNRYVSIDKIDTFCIEKTDEFVWKVVFWVGNSSYTWKTFQSKDEATIWLDIKIHDLQNPTKNPLDL